MNDYIDPAKLAQDYDANPNAVDVPLDELSRRTGKPLAFDGKKALFMLCMGISRAEVARMVGTSTRGITFFVKSLSPQTQDLIERRTQKRAARDAAKAAKAKTAAPATNEATPTDAPTDMSPAETGTAAPDVITPPVVTASETHQDTERRRQYTALDFEKLRAYYLDGPFTATHAAPWYEVTAARIAPVLASLSPEDSTSTLGAVHSLIYTIVQQDFLRFQSRYGGEADGEPAGQ